MEIKKDNEKIPNAESFKKTDNAVFELAPESKKKTSSNSPSFSLGFIAGFLVMGIVAIGLLSSKILPSPTQKPPVSATNAITVDDAKIKAETFINENLMQPGTKIAIKGAEEKSGLYKISVNNGGAADIDTYMSNDGKILFLQAVDMEKVENDKKAAQANPPTATPKTEIAKSDKPNVELFVMSHCPYGAQMEKGILPAVQVLGNKINFDVKFTDYSMHGDKELTEELNQYCIKTDEPAKYNTYLKCFVESTGGDSATCLQKANINTSKLTSCVAATDSKFKVTANAADKSTWKGNFPTFNIYKEDNAKYGVQGSPTLIINGATSSSSRDSNSLLKAICSAFTTPPKECNTALSSESPAPGFGTGTAANGNSASCGN